MRSVAVRSMVVMAWLIPVGVLVQAFLAGQGLFTGAAAFEMHGGIGHLVLLLSGITAVLAWLLRAGRGAAVMAGLVVVVLVVQTGLGYAGRRGGAVEASAVHVPLGVAVFGIALITALLLSQPAGGERRSSQSLARTVP